MILTDYLRSDYDLCWDIAKECGTLGTMSALTRSACGIFDLSNGVSVEEFENSLDAEKYIIQPENTVNFEKLVLTDKQATRILNGLFDNYGIEDGLYSVYNCDEFWGVGEVQNGVLRIKTYVR